MRVVTGRVARHAARGLTLVAWFGAGVTACAPATGARGAADGPGRAFVSRRDEVVRIGSFASLQAVAASRRYVYAAGADGIAIYDRLGDRWLPPLTREAGFTDRQVTVMAGDPVEEALWMGVPGGIVLYRPLTEQVQRTMLTGVPDLIVFDRSGTGDAFVRSGGQWTRVSRVGITTPLATAPAGSAVIVPPALPQLVQAWPQLRMQPQLFVRGADATRPQRPLDIVAASASPDRSSELWLATNGDGLVRLDPTFQQGRALAFGLLEPGVGALAPASDGVWIAGLGESRTRAGLTFATPDLQRWRWIDGTIAVPLLGTRTFALASRAHRVWMGTDRGLVRVDTRGTGDLVAWTRLDGLADERVLALAPQGEGTWIGTPRGLTWVSDFVDAGGAARRDTRTRGVGPHLLDGVPVQALQAVGDTLWVGTSAGLLAIPRALSGGAISRPVSDDPALRRGVRALAWSDSVLLAATDGVVLRLAPRAARAPQRVDALDPTLVGVPTRVGIDAWAMWVAGTDGLVIVSRASGARHVLRSGGDLRGAVTDVVATRDWFFVGTPAGLVRVRRTSDGTIP